MDSLTAKLRTGQIKIKKVPLPILQKGCVLVRNHYSLISSGTEASTVMTARKGFVGKAKERPQQLQQLMMAQEYLGVNVTGVQPTTEATTGLPASSRRAAIS